MEVEVDGEEISVTVRGVFTKGRRGQWTLKNGDPGYPDDPDEVDDIEAVDDEGKPVELDDAALEKAEELLLAKGADEEEPDYPEREDD
jgi:hypothetical protein